MSSFLRGPRRAGQSLSLKLLAPLALLGAAGIGTLPAPARSQPLHAGKSAPAADAHGKWTLQPAAPSQPLLAQTARRAGIRRCVDGIALISRGATAAAQRQDVLMDWNRASPNDSALFSLTAMEAQSGNSLMSLVSVPEPDGLGCSMLVETISTKAQACSAVAKAELPGYTRNALLPTVDVYTRSASPQETVVLAQQGKRSCLMVWRHVQYGWNLQGRAMQEAPRTGHAAPSR
ncbi:hypothetical protein [Comamonas sp. BIGb0124]|uniref:hypothetical protein n=1 Tax=Comamonas sp. BIGb0124 TaxID=2485130 RepID=UPI0011CD48F7|nr:hypothetical protein [Comamonas sp. BIGb0124]